MKSFKQFFLESSSSVSTDKDKFRVGDVVKFTSPDYIKLYPAFYKIISIHPQSTQRYNPLYTLDGVYIPLRWAFRKEELELVKKAGPDTDNMVALLDI